LAGCHRDQYGTKVFENIAYNINIKGLTRPELSRCRQFYSGYPQILGLLTQESRNRIPNELQLPNKVELEKFINKELKNM
jgi:hypothetical protein